jgi:hypothetical protein
MVPPARATRQTITFAAGVEPVALDITKLSKTAAKRSWPMSGHGPPAPNY